MRITNNMLVNNMLGYMNTNLERMDKYQNQLATGKKISVPSDDPVVAARALKLRTSVSQIEQYQKNVTDAKSWMSLTETALANIGDIIQTAKEKVTEASTGTVSKTDEISIRDEINQLKNQLVNIANSTYSGRYIFSGLKTDKKLMNDDGTFAINVGENENIYYEIGISDDININVVGGDIFNTPAASGTTSGVASSGTTGGLIAIFNGLGSVLGTGDKTLISSYIDKLDSSLDNVLSVRSDLGARENRLDLTADRLSSDYDNFTALMSDNEDVDEAEAIMNLQNAENVYQASLSGGARIIQTSLLDFLK